MAVHCRLTVVTGVVVIWLLRVCEAECPAPCSCDVAQDDVDTDAASGRAGVAVRCAGAQLKSLAVVTLPPAAVSLDVSGNRLDRLDAASLPSPAGVDRLSTANFSRNRIAAIATESFGGWSGLVSLDLSANRLSSIDHGTFRGGAQTSLQNLDLSANRLTDVDGAFSGMTNLFRSAAPSH